MSLPPAALISRGPTARTVDGPWAVGMGLVGVVVAEFLVAFVSIPHGALVHALLLASLLACGATGSRSLYRRCLGALALVPLLRLVGLALIIPDVSSGVWGSLAAVALIAGVVLMMRALGVTSSELRFGLPTLLAPGMLAAATALVYAPLVAIAAPGHGAIDEGLVGVPHLILIPIAEELTFRGVIQGTMRSAFGRPAIVYANMPFTAVYLPTHSPLLIILTFSFGLVLGWATERSRSVWPAIVAHAVLALGAGLLLPAAGQLIA